MTCPLPFPVALMAGSGPAPTRDAPLEHREGDRPSATPLTDRLQAEGGEHAGRTRLVRVVHALATGSIRRRRQWTPVGLTVFAVSLAGVVLGGWATDGLLSIATIPGGPVWTTAGLTLIGVGLTLCAWCVGLFVLGRGTPVPVNPPERLIRRGPYAWVRNPMLTGVFAALFGTGLLLGSVSMVVLWVPAYVLLHVLELKWVEEPELERRFGAAYRAYRDTAPMFVPRFRRQP